MIRTFHESPHGLHCYLCGFVTTDKRATAGKTCAACGVSHEAVAHVIRRAVVSRILFVVLALAAALCCVTGAWLFSVAQNALDVMSGLINVVCAAINSMSAQTNWRIWRDNADVYRRIKRHVKEFNETCRA